MPVEERLTLNAGQRYAVRERAKREIEDAEMRRHSFRPSTNAVSEQIVKLSADHRPIYARADDVRRAKERRLREKKAALEKENPDLTFQPKISSTSASIAKGVFRENGIIDTSDVVGRLAHEARILEDRKNSRRKAWEEQEAQRCRFKPKVSKVSQEIVKQHPEYQGRNKNFLARQRDFEKRKRERNSNRDASFGEAAHCTFKPRIGNAEKVLVHTNPERLSETSKERVQRLYKGDSERKRQTQEAIREEHYGKFNFKPKINRISKLLGCSTGGFEELYKNESGKRAKEAVKRAIEEERSSDCTFQPRIKSSGTMGYKPVNHLDATTVLESIDDMRRDKEEKLEQMRREVEHEKMKECTFEPTILGTAAVVKSKTPVIVRGLGRFLETREHAKTLEEEKAQRERDAFRVKRIHRAGGITVTKPFKFSSATTATAERSQKIREETMREAMRECTFQPRTSYSKNKAVIRHLLSEE